MRTRLIRPIFWADAKVASLPTAARLTFMGLWGLCDDDGYFDWRPDEVAAELYRYAPPKARLRAVEDHLARLVAAKCIQRLDCGQHGLLESMPKHRIQSGRHTFPVRDQHLGHCVAGRVPPRPSASRSDTVSDSVTETVRIGSVMGASPRDASPLDAVASAVGGWAGNHAAGRKA